MQALGTFINDNMKWFMVAALLISVAFMCIFIFPLRKENVRIAVWIGRGLVALLVLCLALIMFGIFY